MEEWLTVGLEVAVTRCTPHKISIFHFVDGRLNTNLRSVNAVFCHNKPTKDFSIFFTILIKKASLFLRISINSYSEFYK